MSRRGMKEVDRYKLQKYGVDIPIRLNKESGSFVAEYEDQIVTAPTLEGIRSALYKEVHNRVGLPWQPIIEVSVDGSRYTFADVVNDSLHNGEVYQRKHMRVEGGLKVRARRYWLAKRPDGAWMECEIWDSRDWIAEGMVFKGEFLGTDDRRINAREFYPSRNDNEFSLPYTVKADRSGEGEVHYLPYDESMWQALNMVGDKMGELHSQLQKLVGSDGGRRKLASFAQRLLPGAK